MALLMESPANSSILCNYLQEVLHHQDHNLENNGFFWMKVPPPKRVVENDLVLQFTQDGSVYQVYGSGENRLGAFSLNGTYNPETMDMICTKMWEWWWHVRSRYKPIPSVGRSTRQRSGEYDIPEREYRTTPRQATPSFLRESVNVPPGLNEDMRMCYKSLKRLMVRSESHTHM